MIHWNYLLALEDDLVRVSRYIEFNSNNFSCYSVELSHLLLSVASEVDVVAKALAKSISPSSNIESDVSGYRKIIKPAIPHICSMEVYIPRYNLKFVPWDSWRNDTTPQWWKAYNAVKHERNSCFHEANLSNTLNAFAGLLALLLYYYRKQAEKGLLIPLSFFKPGLEGRLIKSNINPGMTGVRYIFP